MKGRVFILSLFVLFIVNCLNAQKRYLSEHERTTIIYNQLSAKSKNIVKKLVDDEESANKLMDIADKYYQELAEYRIEAQKIEKKNKRYKLYKKMEKVESAALQYRVEALDNFHGVAVRKYQLFKEDIQKFHKQSSSAKIDSSKSLEKLAHDAFADAEVKVQIAYHTVNHGEQFDIYTRAYVLEQIGLLYQHKIYAMFLAWNMATSKQIDKEIESLLKNEPLNTYSEDKNQQIVKDSIVYKEVLIHDTIIIEKENSGIIYRVQIAASKVPVSMKELQKIYPANSPIHTSIENGWYKYSVGLFNTYREAQKFKINIGVKDAFVVAYINNNRVDISEALKEEKQ
ncbi:MAG: hypothetical protein L3J74_10945 [Bacteroidales bacterium]|nr:hypothetical protein [Bacteroidales bacterium]